MKVVSYLTNGLECETYPLFANRELSETALLIRNIMRVAHCSGGHNSRQFESPTLLLAICKI